jgi:hypothetical protein
VILDPEDILLCGTPSGFHPVVASILCTSSGSKVWKMGLLAKGENKTPPPPVEKYAKEKN